MCSILELLCYEGCCHVIWDNEKDYPPSLCGWSKGLQLRNFVFKTCLDGCQTLNTDVMLMGSGDLKSNKGLATRLEPFMLVQEGIEGWKDRRQWPEVA